MQPLSWTLALLMGAMGALVVLPVGLHAATPIISEISKDRVVDIGDDVEFNCTVKNVGRMSVSWAKQGSESVALSMRNILSLSDPRYAINETKDERAGSATYAFRITKVEASDMGPYECQVILSAADKISKKFTLAVRHPPIINDEKTVRSSLVTEGSNLEVTCYATGYPQPIISWRREDNGIMPAGGQTVAGPTLRIKQTHRLDRGAYVCMATSDKYTVNRVVRVEVEFRPQIAVQRPKVAQVLSHVAKLECSVQAYPAPAISWHRNGTKLQTDSQYEISNTASLHETTTSVLRIASVEESDFGDYYCNATNKLGHADARLNLFQPVVPVPSSD